jgi:hypothetical protein
MITGHRMAVAASLRACNECGVVGTAAKQAVTNDVTRKFEQ